MCVLQSEISPDHIFLASFVFVFYVCRHSGPAHESGKFTALKLKITFVVSNSCMQTEPMLFLARIGLKCHPRTGMLQQELAGMSGAWKQVMQLTGAAAYRYARKDKQGAEKRKG